MRLTTDTPKNNTGRKRFCEEAIGRTVFLTEEKAEKALQEMEDKT